jgi:hypothetical protein
MIQLARHFADDFRRARLEAAQRQQWFIKAREEQKRRDEMAEEVADEVLAAGVAAVMATEAQLADFRTRLDFRDAATIEALDENRIKLEDVQQLLLESEARIQGMLDRAYVLEDGRRVFLTEDRSQAFDEFGEEVSQDAFDFDAVPYNAPTYEAFAGEVDLRNDLVNIEEVLTNERQNILDYQDQLDEVRDRIADGNITESELDELDANLLDAMPVSVRRHMPGANAVATNDPDGSAANIDAQSIDRIRLPRTQSPAVFELQ